jgi:ABC-type glutathione transport system ATPase component
MPETAAQPRTDHAGPDVTPDVAAGVATKRGERPAPVERTSKRFQVQDVDLYYGSFHAVQGVTMTLEANQVTALIGSSGCGKTTMLRSLNRMHELTPNARVEGQITLDDEDIYAALWAWSSRRPIRSRRCRSTRTSPPASR